MSKKDKHKNKEGVKQFSSRKIKHATLWAIGLGIIGTIIYLAVTAPKIALGEYESTTGLHYHTVLLITINGEEIPIPEGIGLTGTVHNPLHIHDADNKIHMEFEDAAHFKVKKDDIRLGKFFEVWGEQWTPTSFMGNPIDGTHTLTMKVNGKETTEYGHYLMRDKDVVTLEYK